MCDIQVIPNQTRLFGRGQPGFFPTSHAAVHVGYVGESHLFQHLGPKRRHLAAASSRDDLPRTVRKPRVAQPLGYLQVGPHGQ